MAEIKVQVVVDKSALTTLQSELKNKDYKINVKANADGVTQTNSETQKLDSNIQSTTRSVNDLGSAFISKVKWGVIQSSITGIATAFKTAVNNMKEVDTQLTNVAKVTGQSVDQLGSLADKAYSTASKYGVEAGQYMEAVYEYTKAGFKENADEMAELSTKAMLVGDTTATIADKFLIAGNAAFGFEGNIQKLSMMVDQADYINNNYATTLDKIAEGFPRVASVASMAGMSAEETMAALGTITATTQETASRASTALRALIINILGDTNTEIEDGVTATEESIKGLRDALKKYAPDVVAAADATGKLIDPMQALQSLAEAYRKGDLTERGLFDIETALGGKLRTNQLDALLKNFGTYKEMLEGMGTAAGTADQEIETMLTSWESKIKILENTWTEMVSKTVSSDFFKGLIDGVTQVLNSFGNLQNMLVTLGGTIVALSLAKKISEISKAIKDVTTSAADVKKLEGLSEGLSVTLAVVVALTAAYTAANAVTQQAQQEREQYLQTLKETSDAESQEAQVALENAQNLQALYTTYQQTKTAYEEGTGAKEDYLTATENLASALGVEASAVDGVKQSYEGLVEEQMKSAELQAQQAELSARDYAAYYVGKDKAEEMMPEGLETLMNMGMMFTSGQTASAIKTLYGFGAAAQASDEDIDSMLLEYRKAVNTIEKYNEAAKGKKNYFNELPKLTQEGIEKAKDVIAKNKDWADPLLAAQEKQKEIDILKFKIEHGDVENMEAATEELEHLQDGYDSLASSVDKAKSAIEEFNNATKEKQGDTFKDYASAYEAFLKDWEAGLKGSSNVFAAEDLFFTDEQLVSMRKKGVDAGEVLASDFMKSFFTYTDEEGKRQFTSGEDFGAYAAFAIFDDASGNNLTEGYQRVGNEIRDVNDQLVASFEQTFDEQGNESINLMVEDLDALGAALNIDPTFLGSLLEALGVYNPGFEENAEGMKSLADSVGALKTASSGDVINVEEFIKGLQLENMPVSKIQSIIDKMIELAQQGKIELDMDLSNLDLAEEKINNIILGVDNAEASYEKFMRFGNIDLSNREKQVNADGSFSTVLGGSAGFDIGEQVVEIAFSPMLQTGTGTPVELTDDQVNRYLRSVIDKATEDGKWDVNEIIAIDAEGLEQDGEHISGLIAEISEATGDLGNKARTTGEEMHNISELFGDFDINTQHVDELDTAIENLQSYITYLQDNDEIDIDFKTQKIQEANDLLAEVQKKKQELGSQPVELTGDEMNQAALDLHGGINIENSDIDETQEALDLVKDTASEVNDTKYAIHLDDNKVVEAHSITTMLQNKLSGLNQLVATPQVRLAGYEIIMQQLSQIASATRNIKLPGGKQASGTDNAIGGLTLVNEEGPEIIAENGIARIAGGGLPAITVLQKGATVFNADDTRKIFERSGIKALSGGTVEGITRPDGSNNNSDNGNSSSNNSGSGNSNTTPASTTPADTSSSNTDEQLEALKAGVERAKSWLKLSETNYEVTGWIGDNYARQAEWAQEVANALREQINYLQEHNGDQTEINNLESEYLGYVQQVTELKAKDQEEADEKAIENAEQNVSLRKSELEVLEAQNKPISEQIAKQREIYDSLGEQMTMLWRQKKHQEENGQDTRETEEAINKIIAERAEIRQDIRDKQKEEKEARAQEKADQVSLLKSELSLLEARGASVKKRIEKEREIAKAIKEQIKLAKLAGATQEEINKLTEEYYGILKNIESEEKGLLDDLSTAISNKISKINEKRDKELAKLKEKHDLTKKQNELEEKQNDIEEKRVKLAEAREKLANAKKERTVRTYNAKTGQWEWVANAKDVESAREGVKSAREALQSSKDSLKDYLSEEKYQEKVDAINAKYDAQVEKWQKVIDAITEPAMSLSKAFKNIEKNATKAMGKTLKALNKLLKPLGYNIDTSNLYDEGGVLKGLGGIKAVSADEMILPPDLTKAMLNPVATSMFNTRLNELRYLYGATTGMNSNIGTSVGEQINGGTFYQYGNITLTESQAKTTTVYDLAQMARGLRSYTATAK